MSKIKVINDYEKDGSVVVIKNDFVPPAKKIKNEKEDKVNIISVEEKTNAILKKANEEALDIENKARENAKKILNDAYLEAKRIKEEAYKSGFEEGNKQGFAEGQKEFFSLSNKAKEVIDELLEEKYKILNDMESEMVRLSMAIAKKIIASELKLNKKAFISVISEGLKSAINCERVIIKVSENDYEDVIKSKDILRKNLHLVKSFEIVKDEILSSYDCLIETESVTINASINSQVQKINQVLEESLA